MLGTERVLKAERALHSPAAIALQSHRRGVYTSGRDRARPHGAVDRQAGRLISEDVPASLFNRADRVHADASGDPPGSVG